jgi:hypothetical protein
MVFIAPPISSPWRLLRLMSRVTEPREEIQIGTWRNGFSFLVETEAGKPEIFGPLTLLGFPVVD